jgi:hypothetical protein
VAYLAELLASGTLTPLVGRRYPLEQIVEAYRYVEVGQKLGNVVIVDSMTRRRRGATSTERGCNAARPHSATTTACSS